MALSQGVLKTSRDGDPLGNGSALLSCWKLFHSHNFWLLLLIMSHVRDMEQTRSLHLNHVLFLLLEMRSLHTVQLLHLCKAPYV